MCMAKSAWFESVYPVVKPFRDEAIEVIVNRGNDSVWVLKLLQVLPKVIRACRKAGCEMDEAEVLQKFASMVFQHLVD